MRWLVNQFIIFIFGLSMGIIGYDMYENRFFTDYHYHITVDLGEYHQYVGLAVMIISISISIFAIFGFYKKMGERILQFNDVLAVKFNKAIRALIAKK